jgi:fluoride exporter
MTPNDGPFAERPRRTHASPRVLAAIAVGGFAGGLARYEIGLAFPTRRGAFPAATFAINVSGSFVLALLLVFVLEIWSPTRYVRPLLCIGFCGAYTTFSTWMVDTDRLMSAGHYAAAGWNLLGSLVAGLAATSLGLTCGRAVAAHRRRRRGHTETTRAGDAVATAGEGGGR